MKHLQDRRLLIKGIAGGLTGIVAARFGMRSGLGANDSDGLETVRLSENLVQIKGGGGNVVVLRGPSSLALVDSGAPEHTEALLGFVAERHSDLPVEMLINTHWHLPHTGANERIGETGARIVAHENTRLWMNTEYYVDWQDTTYSPRPAAALPNETFYSSDPQPIELELGGHRIECAHLPEAHTDGDIYVRFPGENVIAAGGVVSVGAYPIPDHATGGWIGGLAYATRMLIELSDADTQIVPGTGPVQTRAELQAQLEMLETVQQRVNSMMTEGKSAAEMLAEGVTAGYDEKWGDPSQFIANVYESMWWGGRVRGPI